MSIARKTLNNIRTPVPSDLDWKNLFLDGLRPKGSKQDALGTGNWGIYETEEDYIISKDFGRIDLGIPYSYAQTASGRILSVCGKVLTVNKHVLVEVGGLWEDAKSSLNWNGKDDIVSPDNTLKLLIVQGIEGIVEAIQLECT